MRRAQGLATLASMTIDTLEYAKELEAAGVTAQQAEAHARALKKAVDSGLATKPDIDNAVTRLDGRITSEANRLDGRLNLLTWMVGFNLATSVALLWKLLR